MLSGPFALALAAGMAATVNPCGFAMLPAYLAMFVGSDDAGPTRGVPRALAVSASLTAGFVAVFGLFGLAIAPLAVSIERYLPWATIVIGVVLVGVGIALLGGRELAVRIPKLSAGGRDGGVRSMFVFGVSYAVASLSCTIGPFLAVTSTTLGSTNLASGVAVFVVYALGMGLVVTALTVAVALARDGMVRRLRGSLAHVSRISGGLLVLAGAYVAWFGWFEIRTLSGGDGRDPVIDRGSQIQAWLQRTVLADRPVVAAAVLAAAIALVAATVWWRRSRRAAPAGTTPTPPADPAADPAAADVAGMADDPPPPEPAGDVRM